MTQITFGRKFSRAQVDDVERRVEDQLGNACAYGTIDFSPRLLAYFHPADQSHVAGISSKDLMECIRESAVTLFTIRDLEAVDEAGLMPQSYRHLRVYAWGDIVRERETGRKLVYFLQNGIVGKHYLDSDERFKASHISARLRTNAMPQ